MKKRIIFAILSLCLLSDIFAYKLETIREYPFDENFTYYESWPDDEGYHRPGITQIFVQGNDIEIYCLSTEKWIIAEEEYKISPMGDNGRLLKFNDNRAYCIRNENLYIFNDGFDFLNPTYNLDFSDDVYLTNWDAIYETENYVYAQVGKGSLVSWELKGEGKSEYRDAGKTWELLRKDGMLTRLGITMDEDGSEIYFGEFMISKPRYPNIKNIWKKQTFKTAGYENYKNVEPFRYLGTTKNGIGILYISSLNYATYKPEEPIEVKVFALDPWTKEVNVIELEPSCWNPPRTRYGLIPAVSQCIDEEGNVYFTDCNKEKGCYEIKKLSNEWLNQYEFANRPIARMKANHIALQEYPGEPKEEEAIYGYNFDHEYLWILSKTGDWLKVRKVDGREGWVNMQYVTVNEGTDLTPLELTNKDLKAMEKARKAKK